MIVYSLFFKIYEYIDGNNVLKNIISVPHNELIDILDELGSSDLSFVPTTLDTFIDYHTLWSIDKLDSFIDLQTQNIS